MTREQLENFIEDLLAMRTDATDAQAWNKPHFFPAWHSDRHYTAGDRVHYHNELYRCLLDHDAQPAWTPDTAPSLWVRIDDPAIEWPEWKQPAGSADAYMAGDKVTYQERHWISDVDNNVWIPGVYGWTEVA